MRRFFSTALAMVATAALFGSTAVVAGAAPPKPSKITLNATAKTLTTGQKFTAKVKAVTPRRASKKVRWTSSKKSVATVTGKGVVKAVGAGTATITARSVVRPKVTRKIKVTVKANRPAIVVDPKLLGGWQMLATGLGLFEQYKTDGTWTSIAIMKAPYSPWQFYSKGYYQARNGQIRYFNVMVQQRKDDSEPWSAWKPAAKPNRVQNYVVATDEYGDYLSTEDHPDPVTEESGKYRRSND